MVNGWWDWPVRVMIGNNTAHNVGRVARAADLLLNEWPAEKGPAYMRAREAILKALEEPNSDSARVASRLAFEEAAREAGIFSPLPEDESYIRGERD